ncbi:MAG: MmgE/PrpD family protein [Sphingomonadales bacterium]|nr:MmgE/PrpD family protein [Sphingomonadales bacterium]
MRWEALPAATVQAAKWVLLDAAGVMLGASGLCAEPRAFIELARAMGPGPCTVVGTAVRAGVPMAALANGALAHALDFEDAFDLAPGHPNASLVPALIALAQAGRPVDGRRFLTALAVGGDLSCRMGLALRRPMEAGNWYPPPMLAAYGATAGAASLLGLDARQVRDALSITLCQATMPGEIKYSAGTVLRAVREAFPAQAAVQSALLARAGVAGFEQPLEGRAGFYALYAGGEFVPGDLTDALGRRFWIDQLTFKPWPSCRGTHPFIELALDLRARHAIDPAAITRIEIDHDDVQTMLVEPSARKRAPRVAIDAKFSIPFTVALALARGGVGLDDFDAAALADPRVLALAAKVTCRQAPRAGWQRGSGGAMRILWADGAVVEAEVDNALGCPARPLGEAALVAKFLACAGRAQVPRGEALAEAILALETCADVGALFA